MPGIKFIVLIEENAKVNGSEIVAYIFKSNL